MSRLKRQRLTADGKDNVTASGYEVEESNIENVSSKGESGRPKEQQRRSLFVRSLPASTTSEGLTNLFSQSFPLKHATVVVDPVTKKSKGYGFVTFADVEDAQSAKDTFDRTLFEGQRIKVELAEPRQRQLNADGSTSANKKISSLSRQKPEFQPPPKLIVRNLPWTIKEPDQLAALFRSYGKVKHASMPKKKPGLSTGFGFVVLRGRRNAEKALEGVNGKDLEGRTLAVDWAVDKEVWDTLKSGNEERDSQSQSGGDSAEIKGNEKDTKTANLDQDDASDSDSGGSDTISYQHEEPNEETAHQASGNDVSTLFMRNLPFSCTDEILREQFQSFGPIRYARIVFDPATERSKGTGFVCFYSAEDADACLRESPRVQPPIGQSGFQTRGANAFSTKQSLLEDTSKDLSGLFTVDGRVLQVSRAVDRREATRLTFAGNSLRDAQDKDKRRLYLLSEGTVLAGTPLYDLLSATEVKMREGIARQGQSLVKSNPSLYLSLTRLSIRNLPRTITSKDLKALAREAVVGFARDVKSGVRKQLSKEELARDGEEMREAEKARKAKGKGIVKQAKVEFEGREGGKVPEKSGAGRSRGCGFIEYTSHRWALMGLRWLNGHAVGPPQGIASKTEAKERKKRLIVEFAIENAQVVARRHEREAKARERSKLVSEQREKGEIPTPASERTLSKDQLMAKTRKGMMRKRPSTTSVRGLGTASVANDFTNDPDKASKRQQIIGRKRMMRRLRGKAAFA